MLLYKKTKRAKIRKKEERWDQNELRSDGTINTHPFSHS
jgi:hypothetical protein